VRRSLDLPTAYGATVPHIISRRQIQWCWGLTVREGDGLMHLQRLQNEGKGNLVMVVQILLLGITDHMASCAQFYPSLFRPLPFRTLYKHVVEWT